MSVLEIVSGALLILSGIFIILVTLLQESKQPGMTSAIGGGSNESFYGKNSSRTREARLIKLTRIMAGVFFLVTLAVNVIPLFTKG